MEVQQQTLYLFWIFGLLNNVLYVVILSAAMDIVGNNTPKSVVLLADIVPSLTVKLLSPFFIHLIPYKRRIAVLIVVNILGMLIIATSHSVPISMFGIVLASSASGFGETTFLQLTNYYDKISLHGWSSGTGFAGLFGSFVYMVLTSFLKLEIQTALLIFSVMPLGFLLYFKLAVSENAQQTYEALQVEDTHQEFEVELKKSFRQVLQKVQVLVVPYMLPLTSVYFFEYLINQGVSPTLLFPIAENSAVFHRHRDQYVAYGTLYQLGVFISRSSGHYFRIRNLFFLSYLQGINLVIAIVQSYYFPIHSIYPVLGLVFYEGLLGGSSYVNTFLNVTDDFHVSAEREFALGAVSIGDSFGTMLAAFAGVFLEPSLCGHQVATGRPWCQVPS